MIRNVYNTRPFATIFFHFHIRNMQQINQWKTWKISHMQGDIYKTVKRRGRTTKTIEKEQRTKLTFFRIKMKMELQEEWEMQKQEDEEVALLDMAVKKKIGYIYLITKWVLSYDSVTFCLYLLIRFSCKRVGWSCLNPTETIAQLLQFSKPKSKSKNPFQTLNWALVILVGPSPGTHFEETKKKEELSLFLIPNPRIPSVKQSVFALLLPVYEFHTPSPAQ